MSPLQKSALFLQTTLLSSLAFVPTPQLLRNPTSLHPLPLQSLAPKQKRWGVTPSSHSENNTAGGDRVKLLEIGTAQTALEKLLEKQRAELRETERMLAQFTSHGLNVTTGDLNGDSDSRVLSSDVATSILSAADYGFVSRSEGATTKLIGGSVASSGAFDGYGPPSNIIALGVQQFKRNLDAIFGKYDDERELTPKQVQLQAKLRQLSLNVTAIWEREKADAPVEAPWLIKIPYIALCYSLDTLFEGRYAFSRFFLLETVARMPYFSYISMLHFYETLGFWRRSSDIKRIHFAEEWNEFHHLLIMESLGGEQQWWVRFMAQHAALAYYVMLTVLWAMSPTISYKFSEMLETHAVHTYTQFLEENEELLRELPASLAAVEYYSFGASDPFFGEYQTSRLGDELRRPGENMNSLYDVFTAIRDDEGDHVSTMVSCLDPQVAVRSPSLEKKVLVGAAMLAAFGYVVATGGVMDVDLSSLTNVGDVNDIASEASKVAGDIGDAVQDDTLAESIAGVAEAMAAAAAALGNQLMNDEEEGGLATKIVEGEMFVSVGASVKAIVAGLIELLEKIR